jgi:hypothetical protein
MATFDFSDTRGRLVPAPMRVPQEQQVKIPTNDWFALPAEMRRAINGCPFVLAGKLGHENFVPAILV